MNHPSAPVIRWILIGLALTLSSVHPAERSAGPGGEGKAVPGYFPPPDSAGGWREAKDAGRMAEQAGMSLPRLEQAWEFTRRCTQHGGLLVVRQGWLVFEKYFGRASRDIVEREFAWPVVAARTMDVYHNLLLRR